MIARHLRGEVHRALEKHFADDPKIEAIVERREGERRKLDRRRDDGSPPIAGERRNVPGSLGRRVAERRAVLEPVEGLALPRSLRRHADLIAFVSRTEPSSVERLEIEGTRLAVRVQRGDDNAADALYVHYYDRLLSWLSVGLRDWHQAEDLAHDAFVKALVALPSWERRGGSHFGAWLFTIARNELLTHLRRHGRVRVEEGEEIAALRDERQLQGRERVEAQALTGLDWVSDADLNVVVGLLDPDHQVALSLRYQFDLTIEELADVLGKSPEAVKKQLQRSLVFLEQRLAGAEARNLRRRRSAMLIRMKPLRVLARRRFALSSSPAGALLRARPPGFSRRW